MTLVRWQPISERAYPWGGISSLQRRINRMLDGFMGDEGFANNAIWNPRVDMVEHDDNFRFTVELPGVDRSDVKVELQNNILTISGEKRSENEKKDRNFCVNERLYGSFRRSFQLPSEVDADKINAEFENGVLTATLPKAETAKPKQIEVKVH